jgi:hypothetical protein
MKTCNKCKVERPLDEFYKSKREADGHCSKCKVCQMAYEKAYTASRKAAKARVEVQSKVCRTCHLEKPISQFGKKSTSFDKHNIYCKPCWRIRTYSAIKRQNARA